MAENLKSNVVTNLDATPSVMPTAGEGAQGEYRVNDDVVSVTASTAQWSTYRLCRIPTNAKIKHVWAYLSGIDSKSTATATFDFNIAFSDDTTDGTQAVLQGTVPSSKNDGTSIAFVSGTGYATSYASSGTGNKLFGTITGKALGTVTQQEITYSGTFTPANAMDDLWNVLGFTNSLGAAQDPGGMFDIFVVVSAAVGTAATGTIGAKVEYVV